MEKKQIATVGSAHTCPMVTGTTPHVGGAIIGPGVPGVFIDGQPVAVLGDMCTCAGPPDTIVTACPGVLIDGKPVATVGSMTAHGGQVTVGVPGVTISSVAKKPAVMPLKKIPFPKISFLSLVVAPKLVTLAKQKQKEVKECVEQKDDKEPRIFNLQWRREDIVINESKVGAKVFLTADTWGLDDGEIVEFDIYLPGEEEKHLEKISGKVADNHVEIEWLVDSSKIKSDE